MSPEGENEPATQRAVGEECRQREQREQRPREGKAQHVEQKGSVGELGAGEWFVWEEYRHKAGRALMGSKQL